MRSLQPAFTPYSLYLLYTVCVDFLQPNVCSLCLCVLPTAPCALLQPGVYAPYSLHVVPVMCDVYSPMCGLYSWYEEPYNPRVLLTAPCVLLIAGVCSLQSKFTPYSPRVLPTPFSL